MTEDTARLAEEVRRLRRLEAAALDLLRDFMTAGGCECTLAGKCVRCRVAEFVDHIAEARKMGGQEEGK